MKERATRIALGLLLIAAVAVAVDNADRPLANPDEGRYSEISREMVASGDWVTPRLNGIKYFEKPPLQYWATAAIFRVAGAGEITARTYIGLCGLLTLLLVGYTARRLFGAEHALSAMMALASSPYFLGLGGIVTLDMGLTLWTTLTLCAFLIAEGAAGDPVERRRWLLVAWAATGLAVLSKGLVGILFPAATMFLYVAARRDWPALARLEWLRGLAILLAITAPWFVAVSAANPEFAEFFFVHEHFTRFLTNEHRRVQHWSFFLWIAAAGFLPWALALPGAIASAWEKERGRAAFRPMLFALLWSAFIVFFFSLSGSKLPAYILPAFPAIALVLGHYLAEAPTRRLAWMILPLALLAVVLTWVVWHLPSYAGEDWTRVLYRQVQFWGYCTVATLFATSIVCAFLLLRGRRILAIVLVALGIVFSIDHLEDAYEELSPRQSGKLVAEKMQPWLSPATRVYSVQHYEQSVPFYIGRTMTLVDYTDEFAPGIAAEPAKVIAHLRDFPPDWLRPGEALAIMQPGLLERLRAQGLPMQVLHEDPRRVLVRKP
jgi:4-amino-4-deoxy-L-arabinose transferase-like glycosyltransferase